MGNLSTLSTDQHTPENLKRDTRLDNPNFLLLTLLADFLYLRLDRVLLYLVWAQLLVDALDEKRDVASFKSCNL